MNILSILRRKFILKKNPKIELLILDDDYSHLKFKKNKYHILKYSEELHLIILFKAILKKITANKTESIRDLYFRLLVDSFNPKIAIGHDMNGRIFKFRKIFPKKISIAYQFSYIFNREIDDYYKKYFKGNDVNYYLVFDKRSKSIMQKFVKSNFIINGSTKINERNPKKKKKKFDIMFISRFRNLKQIKRNNHDGFFVKILGEYCKKNNKRFCIALSSNRVDKKNKVVATDEIDNFKKYSKSFEIKNLDSIKLSEISKLCICTNSQLGYELLLAKTKVLFLNTKSEKDRHFYSDNGAFWYCGKNKNKIERKISNLLQLKRKKWLYLLRREFTETNFNPKNHYVKKLVNSLCNKVSEQSINIKRKSHFPLGGAGSG